jgi:hypothetical protein
MNILEAIEKVDRSESNSHYVDLDELFSEFELPAVCLKEEPNHQLSAYWLIVWNCTNTWVGTSVLFLNDEPVAIRQMSCRKCPVCFHWISKEAYYNVKEEVLKIIKENQKEPFINLIDTKEEFGETYHLQFADPIQRTAIFGGEYVTLMGQDEKDWLHKLKIARVNGKLETVLTSDLKFPIRISI